MTTQDACIALVPSMLHGQAVNLVDARALHGFLDVRRDFTTWIKERIAKYGFEAGQDYLLTQTGEQLRSGTKYRSDYFLTLDMAKELAMVERTPRGRQARRYFIDCERQLRQLQQGVSGVRSVPRQIHLLTRAERQAVNRQAWAEVAGQTAQAFHARREALLRQAQGQLATESRQPVSPANPSGIDRRPAWAR